METVSQVNKIVNMTEDTSCHRGVFVWNDLLIVKGASDEHEILQKMLQAEKREALKVVVFQDIAWNDNFSDALITAIAGAPHIQDLRLINFLTDEPVHEINMLNFLKKIFLAKKNKGWQEGWSMSLRINMHNKNCFTEPKTLEAFFDSLKTGLCVPTNLYVCRGNTVAGIELPNFGNFFIGTVASCAGNANIQTLTYCLEKDEEQLFFPDGDCDPSICGDLWLFKRCFLNTLATSILRPQGQPCGLESVMETFLELMLRFPVQSQGKYNSVFELPAAPIHYAADYTGLDQGNSKISFHEDQNIDTVLTPPSSEKNSPTKLLEKMKNK